MQSLCMCSRGSISDGQSFGTGAVGVNAVEARLTALHVDPGTRMAASSNHREVARVVGPKPSAATLADEGVA